MMFIELFVPKGSLSEEQRRRLGQQLIEVMSEESAPAAVKEMSAVLISRLTRVLAEADQNPQRLYQEPRVWVHVVGVPEGGCGAFGQVMRSTDIIKLVTKPFQDAPRTDAPAPGTAIDPICGMTVKLTDTAITLEHEGTIYAFCCVGCRTVFAEQLRAASQP